MSGWILVWMAMVVSLAVSLTWLLFGGSTTKPLDRFQRGVGWAALCAFPGVVVMAISAGVSGLGPEGLLLIPMAWWMLLGGASVYHACVLSRTEPGAETGLFLFLAVVQTAVVAGIVASRLRKRPTLRDPGILLVGGLVLLNALLLASRSWWGV